MGSEAAVAMMYVSFGVSLMRDNDTFKGLKGRLM